MGNWLSTEKEEELKQKYKYDVYGKFRCPTIKYDHHTHPIKRTLDIFYEFVHKSVQTDHVKLDIVSDRHIISAHKKTIGAELHALWYERSNLNKLSNLYVCNLINVFDKLLPGMNNTQVYVIYNMIDTTSLLPVIIPRCIEVPGVDCSLLYTNRKGFNMLLCIEIKYCVQVPNFYIYDHYHLINTGYWHGIKTNLICEKCYSLISNLDKAHCCDCQTEYMYKNKHCCACKMEYDPKNQSHCCECKINGEGKHCKSCHTTQK